MRIQKQSARYFYGTHKGCSIEIMRENDPLSDGWRFYIWVRNEGGHLYDGYAPDEVQTMAAAKRQAIKGACL